MSTITISSAAVTVTSDEEMLAKVVAAIADITTAAKSYTIFGSRTVTRADLADLMSLERMYRTRILAARGATGIHQLDHRPCDEGAAE